MQSGYSFTTPLEVNDVVPLEFKVIVEPDEVEATTEGGLFLPDVTKDRISYAIETGTILSMAGNAFSDDSLFAEKPKVGDKVLFDKYSGTLFEIRKNREIKKYRIMNDKDVCAILR